MSIGKNTDVNSQLKFILLEEKVSDPYSFTSTKGNRWECMQNRCDPIQSLPVLFFCH